VGRCASSAEELNPSNTKRIFEERKQEKEREREREREREKKQKFKVLLTEMKILCVTSKYSLNFNEN